MPRRDYRYCAAALYSGDNPTLYREGGVEENAVSDYNAF